MAEQTRPPKPEAPCDLLRASKALFRRRLTEIIRHSGIRLPSALEAFGREIDDAHDQLAAASPVEGFEQVTGLTASRLTLIGDDDLALQIRLREIGNHLREAGGHDLWRSQSRYMTLLQRPLMSEAGNPVGPEVIGLGLWAICREYGGDIAQQLALLDRLEEYLGQELPMLYREIDELLVHGGVDPAPEQNAPASSRANPLSDLQQVVRRRLDADQPASPGNFTGTGDAKSGNPALDATAMVMLKHLFERLTALEARSAAAIDDAVAGSPPGSALRALKSGDLDLPPGMPEAITLDTLALIFEALFDSADLPDTIKAAIARLQIPLLKLSLIDPSLFADSHHPARLLIDRIARAAVGLPRNTGWDNPLCQRIGSLTAAVCQVLGQKGVLLDPYLAELELLIDQRDRTIRLAAEAHVQLVAAHENRQSAEQRTRAWLRASLARTAVPEIASFLDQYWSRVMVAAAIDGGTDGKRWREDRATADELIWSVQPKQTAEERKRLAGLASSLIRRIGAGLDGIGIPAAARAPFLDALFDLQTAALRGQPDPPAAGVPAGPNRAPAAKTGPRLLTRDGLRVHYLVQPTDATARQSAPTEGWQVGDWLRFRAADKEPLCGLCCWQSPNSATAVLFNPDWGYAVAMPVPTLDQQIRAGRGVIVSRIAFFDAAAERALKRLDPR